MSITGDHGADPGKVFGHPSKDGIDIIRARRETPGCENVLHFNNAGAALMPEQVVEAVIRHLELEATIGGYEAADRAEHAINRVYEAVARLINCNPRDVAIIENATRAWDMAFYAFKFESGDRILTATAEYASNYLAYLQIAERTGAKIDVVPADEHGQVSVSRLAEMIDDRVKLIAITHVPTNGGLVNPAAEIGKLARDARVPFLLDACQSVGQMPIDVEEIGCDILTGTGRKYLRGPRGTGFLYVHPLLIESLEPPFIDLHAAEWTGPDTYELRPDARLFKNCESFVAGKSGLCVAIEYAMEWGLDAIYARVQALADDLRKRLANIPGVHIRDLGIERCGIVSFTKSDNEAEDIKTALQDDAINVSTSSSSSTLLDMQEREITSVVRASVHYYNTEDEVMRFAEAVGKIG